MSDEVSSTRRVGFFVSPRQIREANQSAGINSTVIYVAVNHVLIWDNDVLFKPMLAGRGLFLWPSQMQRCLTRVEQEEKRHVDTTSIIRHRKYVVWDVVAFGRLLRIYINQRFPVTNRKNLIFSEVV